MEQQRDNLIGEALSFLEAIEKVSLLATINRPVLIVGERGTGKELFAARLHYLSSRWDQAFVKLNCAAINENLLETELFGHESGAFTGANKKHIGRFELAHTGSLFIDELGNSSAAVQEKLLRVIEYGEMERVGGNKTINIDVRIIAATNENLPEMAKQNKFRADLLDRLAFDVITIPPLRDRKTDIPILAEHFALSMTKELGRDFFAGFDKNAAKDLLDYHWPGNVRELKNVIERAIYKTPSDEPITTIDIDPFDSPYQLSGERTTQQDSDIKSESSVKAENTPINTGKFQPPALPLDFKETITSFEVDLIQNAMKQAHFNQKKCAELLGLTYHQLRGYLKKYQLLNNK
ncbi:MAG: phage shock protein operon transcriptional activator [Gammaproteobacteria bacterium]|nr:phage shock protein operon transcriptional activator [Gammaproteobacteria bacterium]MDH5629662.1 phage shock protein operon transcriptional activator [Gammaproteobacteria bacterium]